MIPLPGSFSPRATLLGCLFLVLALAFWLVPLRDGLLFALQWVDLHPVEGRLLFLLICIIAALLIVPGSLLVVGGGYLFGIMQGIILVSLGMTLGATAALLAGRYAGRNWLRRRLGDHPRLAAVDEAVRDRGFIVVLLTRLSLAIPYNLLNYAYGLSSVRVLPYALATLLGMLPAVTLYVYLGSAARSLDTLLRDGVDTGPVGLMLFLVGLGVAVAVVVLLNRTANRMLESPVRE
ncbi:MAG: TVP38/TMEM64 family protein [Gammaproteobacteria bacterium]|nr:TVP38/TMEM64 family protein [Gammaproteobacteria bacterium]